MNAVRARVIPHGRIPGHVEEVNVYGQGTEAEVHAAIAKALPEPKGSWTREFWASKFYDTGVNSGRGRVWRAGP